jgi:hypothetical protein
MLHGADCACGTAPSVTVLFLRGNPAQRRIRGLRLGPDSPQPQSISPAGLSPASRANVPNPPNQQSPNTPLFAPGWGGRAPPTRPSLVACHFQQGPSLCYLPNTTLLVVFRAAAFSLPHPGGLAGLHVMPFGGLVLTWPQQPKQKFPS